MQQMQCKKVVIDKPGEYRIRNEHTGLVSRIKVFFIDDRLMWRASGGYTYYQVSSLQIKYTVLEFTPEAT